MERAGRDKQDVVGLDRAVLGRDRGAFDQRQQVALHAFARDIAAAAAVAHADLVDLVEEHDAVVLDRVDGFQHQLVAVQRIQHALFGGLLRASLHVLALALADLHDRDFNEVADDLLDVAADITDLGELGGLDLDEGRVGQLRQPPRDLGLADAGRPDHQDVFRQHLFAQAAGELQPPPAVAQRDRDRALGVGLADNEAVEFGDDFTGRKVGHSFILYGQGWLREATRERQWYQFQYPGTEWLPSGTKQQHESAEGQDCEGGRYVGKARLADQRPECTAGIGEARYQQSAPV